MSGSQKIMELWNHSTRAIICVSGGVLSKEQQDSKNTQVNSYSGNDEKH